MSAEYQRLLKIFNREGNGNVWAVPRKGTLEKKMLDRGEPFRYNLITTTAMNKQVKSYVEDKDMKKKREAARAYAAEANKKEDERIAKMMAERPKSKHSRGMMMSFE
jgi:hypothetical protein